MDFKKFGCSPSRNLLIGLVPFPPLPIRDEFLQAGGGNRIPKLQTCQYLIILMAKKYLHLIDLTYGKSP
jgi:hypothetical protein